MAVLIAIMFVFGFTPIGYIPMPWAQLTLMCLPVIIGTLVLGPRAGMGLGGIFILTSILQLIMQPTALALVLLDVNPVLCVLQLIIPRLLIAPVTWFAWRLLEKRLPRGSTVIASTAGSLVNTFVYLILMQVWFVGAVAAGFGMSEAAATATIWGIVLTNGLPEAAIAAVVCPLVARAVSKSVGVGSFAAEGRGA